MTGQRSTADRLPTWAPTTPLTGDRRYVGRHRERPPIRLWPADTAAQAPNQQQEVAR